jgi:hypothetical protein
MSKHLRDHASLSARANRERLAVPGRTAIPEEEAQKAIATARTWRAFVN